MSLLRHQVLREYKNIFKAISHATMGDKVAADHFRKGINDALSFFVRFDKNEFISYAFLENRLDLSLKKTFR